MRDYILFIHTKLNCNNRLHLHQLVIGVTLKYIENVIFDHQAQVFNASRPSAKVVLIITGETAMFISVVEMVSQS